MDLKRTLDALAQDEALADDTRRTLAEVADHLAQVHYGALGRFEDLGPIGEGAMGVVRRARDPVLGRTVALKILRVAAPVRLARFIEEARLSAQLQHPCLVPVHELGALPDGRLFFAMKEIEGRTLSEVVQAVHAAAAQGRGWQEVDGWTLRRLVEVVQRVAEAVAYAHSRGVVHRDLKPDNVMLGTFGEVFVLDWGIAKVLARELPRPVESHHAEAGLTRYGDVVGTPVYMAPEQADADSTLVGPGADVWGLGSLLHEVLTGQPPLQGDLTQILARLLSPDLVLDPRRVGSPAPVDDALWTLCTRCLKRLPAHRPGSAMEVAEGLRAWRDGDTARVHALQVLADADVQGPRAAALREQASALRTQAAQALAPIDPWSPEAERHPCWALQDQAAELDTRAALADLAAEQAARAALSLVPSLPDAHAALAERYRQDHAEAEARGDRPAAARARALLEEHAGALPSAHPDREGLGAWLDGDGRLTLHTDPPGAEVRAFRYVEQHRRLVEQPHGPLGTTPLDAVPLPAGRWLLTLHAPGRAVVRYPVWIPRRGHWDGIAPGEDAPTVVPLPEVVPPGLIYVPPGWFQAGTEGLRGQLPRRRLWCDGFLIGEHPVTFAEYGRFLDARAAEGVDVRSWVPCNPIGRYGDAGSPLLQPGPDGYAPAPDEDGDLLTPDMPAVCVDWWGALAYAAWAAEQTGLPLRLPGELEWEKAARGVDGRHWPWGGPPDASRCNTRDSQPGRPGPCAVGAFPLDISPYGVRGTAGNVRDWTGDRFFEAGPPTPGGRVVPPPPWPELPEGATVAGRGGAWPLKFQGSGAGRSDDRPAYRHPAVAFRVAASLLPR